MKTTENTEPGALLETLLRTDPPAAPAIAPAIAPPAEEPRRPATRPRRFKPGIYDLTMETIALLGQLGAAVGLWWIGAQFTLGFLADLGLAIASLSLGKWLIPLTITALEFKLLADVRKHRALNRDRPDHERVPIARQVVVFLGLVALFDLATSTIGGVEWGAGRAIPRINLRLPEGGPWLWLGFFVIGLACAFWAEPLARAAVRDLRKLYKI